MDERRSVEIVIKENSLRFEAGKVKLERGLLI